MGQLKWAALALPLVARLTPSGTGTQVAMVAMLPETRQQMDNASSEFDRRDREKLHDAYRAAGQSEPSQESGGSNPWR